MYCVLMNYYDMAYHNLYVFYGPGLLIRTKTETRDRRAVPGRRDAGRPTLSLSHVPMHVPHRRGRRWRQR